MEGEKGEATVVDDGVARNYLITDMVHTGLSNRRAILPVYQVHEQTLFCLCSAQPSDAALTA